MGAQHVEAGHEPGWMGAGAEKKECTLLKSRSTQAFPMWTKGQESGLKYFRL